MGTIHSDWIKSDCDHYCISITREVNHSEIEECADTAASHVIAGDIGCIDSAVGNILEYDRRAEDQRAQLLRAELVGVDRGSWQGRIGIAGNPYVIMGLHDVPIDRGTRPSLGRTRTSNCYLRVSGGIGASL